MITGCEGQNTTENKPQKPIRAEEIKKKKKKKNPTIFTDPLLTNNNWIPRKPWTPKAINISAARAQAPPKSNEKRKIMEAGLFFRCFKQDPVSYDFPEDPN